MDRFYTFYERFRVSVGHFGIIAGGIAFAALSFFIRTDIFEAILDFVGVLGMTAGIAVSGAGVFMLGREKGWWDRLTGAGEQIGGVPSAPREFEQRQYHEAAGGSEATVFNPAESARYPGSAQATHPDTPAVAGGASPTRAAQQMEGNETPPLGNIEPARSQGGAPVHPSAPTAVGIAPPARTSLPRYDPEIPFLAIILAILPAVLLVLSALPVTPWFSQTDGFGESSAKTLWDTISRIRELEVGDRFGRFVIEWEMPFAAYVLAIIAAISHGIAMIVYQARAFYNRGSVDLFLSVSILISALTLALMLYSLDAIQYWTLVFYNFRGDLDYSLGPYLCGLAALSVIVYLVSLFADRAIRSRFGNINLLTFFGFGGRIARPTFSLITAPLQVLYLLDAALSISILGVLAWSFLASPSGYSDLVGSLIVPFGSSIEYVVAFQYIPTWVRDIPPVIILILWILIIYVWLALCVKRYHDLDKSGWWALVGFIPIIGPIWILIELVLKEGTPGDNRYGQAI